MFKRFVSLNKTVISSKYSVVNLSKSINCILPKFFTSQEKRESIINGEFLNYTDKIKKIVEENLEGSFENYSINENEIKDFLSGNGFNYLREPNSKIVKLEKKLEDKLISIIITPKQELFQNENESDGNNNTFNKYYFKFELIFNKNINKNLLY